MFGFLKKLFGSTDNSAQIKSLIDEGALLVDVRSPQEFSSGSVKGAINVPVDQVKSQLAKFKGKSQIIVFCRSGARSGMAKSILNQNGFNNVTNGGTWDKVNRIMKS